MVKHTLKKWLFPTITTILSCIFLSAPVWAAITSSYYLDQNNKGFDPDNFLKVTVSYNANGNIDFEVEVLRDAFAPYNPGDNFGMDKFFFNYEGSAVIGAQNIVIENPDTWKVKYDKKAGIYGPFEILMKGKKNSRTDRLNFSIVDIEGDYPSDYATGEPFFAAHVAGFSCGRKTAGKFAGPSSAPTPTPIPASALLMGTGLLGLLGLRRSRLKG